MPPSNRRGSANWFPVLVHFLTLINMGVCGVQLLVDFCSFWSVKHDPEHIDEDGYLDASALSGIILISIHFVVVASQIYFGYCLYESVNQRDFVGCRQWVMTTMNIYGLEFLCFVLFAFLAPRSDVFVGLTTTAILYKLIQLWPIDGFIVNLETYSEPLLGEEEFHI